MASCWDKQPKRLDGRVGPYGHPIGGKGITAFSAHFIGTLPWEESFEEDMFDVSDSSNES